MEEGSATADESGGGEEVSASAAAGTGGGAESRAMGAGAVWRGRRGGPW